MYLLIGDMHVKKDNIEESGRLIGFIASVCQEKHLVPIFMGDQYDKHGIIHVEVLDFWTNAFKWMTMQGIVQIHALRGNHDLSGDSKFSPMIAHCQVNDIKDLFVFGNIAAVPFFRDNNTFINKAKEAFNKGVQILLCHQEFNGARFENGFYAPNGINIDDLPKMRYISGHIHKKQLLGDSVFYIGSSRQLTVSDIGEPKTLTILDEKGNIQFIDIPNEICEPFKLFEITPEKDNIKDIPDSPKVLVKISGPKEFCYKIASKLPENVRVRTNPILEKQTIEIKESEGISKAFKKFFEYYVNQHQLDDEKTQRVMSKILEKCTILGQ
jgi:DNA repair exonuclease SbcCD nuclease subunit